MNSDVRTDASPNSQTDQRVSLQPSASQSRGMQKLSVDLSRRAARSGLEVLERYREICHPETVPEQTDNNSTTDNIDPTTSTMAKRRSSALMDTLKHFYTSSGIKYVVLLLVFAGYAIAGGYMFHLMESPNEQRSLHQQMITGPDRRTALLRNITTALKRLNPITNFYCTSQCERLLSDVIFAYDREAGLIVSADMLPMYNFTNLHTSVFYAATLITTIGYGNMYCRTQLGRLATMAYSFFGIPLTLMVLDGWGRVLFALLQEMWFTGLRCVRYILRSVRRRIRNRKISRLNGSLVEGQTFLGSFDGDDDTPLINQIEDTLPLSLALSVVFLYTCFCAAVFRIWETDWTFSEALYFFFISLSTIGLGDQLPTHPKLALAAFILFIIGLSFVSMCMNVFRARIESRYMAAIRMVEQQALAVSAMRKNGGSGTNQLATVINTTLQPFKSTLTDMRFVKHQPDDSDLDADVLHGEMDNNNETLSLLPDDQGDALLVDCTSDDTPQTRNHAEDCKL